VTDIGQYWRDFEARGEARVRQDLAADHYGEVGAKMARQWLEHRDQVKASEDAARLATAQSEQVSAAERAADASTRAAAAAERAAATSERATAAAAGRYSGRTASHYSRKSNYHRNSGTSYCDNIGHLERLRVFP
jgi:hypothetical protein